MVIIYRNWNFLIVLSLFGVLWGGVAGEESYNYVGCFRDIADNRDLQEKEITFKNLRLEDCAAECRRDGWPYAGLQNNQKCFCGPSYGNHGPASLGGCNYTCSDSYECGGYLANSVYYAVKIDTVSTMKRENVFQKEATIFENARRTCIKNDGELATPLTPDDINATLQLAVEKGVEGDKLWFGLHRVPSGKYVWTDATATPLDLNAYTDFWHSPDEQQQNPCIIVHISSGKWESTSCHAHYPFVCKQVAPKDVDIDTSSLNVPEEEEESGPSNLAIYIVMPIFIFCYGGSCLVYCIGKLYKLCKKKKKMYLENEEGYTEFEPENKPAPPVPEKKPEPERPIKTPVQELPTVASNVQPPPGKRGYTPGPNSSNPTSPPDTRPATSQGVMLSVAPTPSKTPEDKLEKRKHKLLQNALKEARERKKDRESKMGSRPETRASTVTSPPPYATIINENDELPIPDKHKKKRKKRDSPDSGDSMTDLLGDEKKEEQPQLMSIQDIMKVKMLMKDHVSKPRRIIAV